MLRTMISFVWALPRNTARLLITLYQHTLSFDHGPLRVLYPHGFCRHSPTCSEYAKDVLRQRGLIVGSWLAFVRILSCNPWSKPSDERLRSLAAKQ